MPLPAATQTPVFTEVTPTVMLDPGGWGEAVAWGDYDRDGDLDVAVSNEGQRLRLYRNNGGGAFDVGFNFGFGNWTGAVWADYDNDGDIDLFAAQATTAKHLYRNDGGLFVDVSSPALSDLSHAHSAAWADVDLDGDVDLFYAIATPPDQLPGRGNRLLRNDGGVLVEATPASLDDPQYGRGCSFGDYDLDGDPDLLVTNYTLSRLYRNDAGAFVDVTPASIAEPGHAGGVAWGDADNDGDFDLAIAKAFSATSRVYRNDGSGAFANVTPPAAATADTAVGISWVDVDLDADLDLFIGALGGNRLLRNDGGFSFADVTALPIGTTLDTHGVGWGDYDGDGDLDVYFANYNGHVDALLRNDTPAAGLHWLEIDVEGVQSNGSGIGARIEVVTGGLRQTRAITAGESYNAMNSLRAHFGLGAATVVDSIVVHWPSGIVQDTALVAADQRLTIVERDVSLGVGVPGRRGIALEARPNPWRDATVLAFTLPVAGQARVTIADLQGRRLRTLVHGPLEAGAHTVPWDGRDGAGRALQAGVYLARLEAPGVAARVRLVRL